MKVTDLRVVGVVGAGIMGSGIAERFAEAGCEVIVWSRSETTLQNCLRRIELNQKTLIEAGLLDEALAQEARRRLRFTSDLKDCAPAQFISENVVEDPQVKQELFARLEEIVAEETVLTTDTSGIPITICQAKCRHPERVVGMHWWNPPHIMPLVEIIKGEKTGEEAAQFAYEVARWLNKVPIMVQKDVPGFVGNRMQLAVMREAFWLLENGVASAEDIDTAVQYGFGFRYPVLGPLRTSDFAGLDTVLRVATHLFPQLDSTQEPPGILRRLVEQGRFGAKTGGGIYNYEPGEVEAIIAERDRQFLQLLKINPGAAEAVKRQKQK